MPRGGGPYGDTFDEFLNGPDYRSQARARQRPSESMHERAAREHAEIVGLAEALAPDMARERNVPIEQVRQELTSGVRYPEPALTSFYHQTLGRLLGSPPKEGEPALARVSRLRGMGIAQDVEGGRRAESLKGLGTLLNLRGAVKDPSALEPAVAEELKRSGLPVTGSLGGLRAPVPKSELEAWRDPEWRKSMEEMTTFEEGLRNRTHASAEMQDVESAAKDLMALDPELSPPEARLMARGLRRDRSTTRPGRASKDYDAFMKSFDGQSYQMAQRKDPQTWDEKEKAIVAQHDKLARAADAELEAQRGPNLGDLRGKHPRGRPDFGAQEAPGERDQFFNQP